MPAVNPGTTNLAAWWSLNETSGNRLDSHGANHLTPGGSVSYAAGKVGNAADFEATTLDYLSVTDNAAVSVGNTDFTICAWVKIESKPSFSPIVTKATGVAGGSEYQMDYRGDATDRFRMIIFNSSSVAVIATANVFGSPVVGAWAFVVGQHNAATDTVSISVNAGAANTTATGGADIPDSATACQVGGQTAVSRYMDGLIDEVCLYKRVLTDDEITWLYNSGNGRAYSALSAAKGLPIIAHHYRQAFGG